MAENIIPAHKNTESLNSATNSQQIVRDFKRDLLHNQYSAAHQLIMKCMKVEDLEPLETEDDILSTGVELTR